MLLLHNKQQCSVCVGISHHKLLAEMNVCEKQRGQWRIQSVHVQLLIRLDDSILQAVHNFYQKSCFCIQF